MINYYIENGTIVINKYAVKYKNKTVSNKVITDLNVIQYVHDDMELNGLISELDRKNIEYNVEELNTEDILQYEGTYVSCYEEARKIIEPTIEELINDKINEIKKACRDNIYKGIDVKLVNGETKHFSLTLEDQININGLVNQISIGNIKAEKGVPYHADGDMCTLFSIEDFTLIANKASEYIISQTAYCNHLMNYVKSLNTRKDIESIYYGMELIGQFLENYIELTAHDDI